VSFDARRRAHERDAEADDPHAEARLLLERVRAGELDRQRVLLLAFAGHPGLRPLLVEELAEWVTFQEADAALDLLLDQPVDVPALGSWVLGLALFDRECALRAMTSAYPAVGAWVAALQPPQVDPEDPYPEYYLYEFETERETATQLINAAQLAVMSWRATGATPVLRAELARASEQAGYLLRRPLPPGFACVFEAPAECAGWSRQDLAVGDDRRRRRLQLEGWAHLLQALGLELATVYRTAQASVLEHLRARPLSD